jgi:NTP pyrophosphatase (non-canonical NTP hydrolase)
MNRLEELLVILSEECAEVQQAAIKCIRFGMTSVSVVDPQGPNNTQRLESELGDMMAMFKLVLQESNLSEDNIMKAAEAKLIKVEKFMKNGKSLYAMPKLEVPHRRKPRQKSR